MPFGTGYSWGSYRQQLCQPSTLPSNKLLGEKEIDRLQDMCFVFGNYVDGCDQFVQYATFPRGWSKVLYDGPDRHLLWHLVDGAGHQRVHAVGWDLFELHCSCRFCFREELGQAWNAVMVHVIDQVTGKSVFSSQIQCYKPRSDRVVEDVDKYGVVTITPYGAALDSALDEARDWIASRYPEYKNPCSYWG